MCLFQVKWGKCLGDKGDWQDLGLWTCQAAQHHYEGHLCSQIYGIIFVRNIFKISHINLQQAFESERMDGVWSGVIIRVQLC